LSGLGHSDRVEAIREDHAVAADHAPSAIYTALDRDLPRRIDHLSRRAPAAFRFARFAENLLRAMPCHVSLLMSSPALMLLS
jgi:hypothetical protein